MVDESYIKCSKSGVFMQRNARNVRNACKKVRNERNKYKKCTTTADTTAKT